MKQLPAGQLKHRITFQIAVDSDDGYNVPAWQDDFSKWASIETGTTNETELSGQVMGEATHTIKCHYSANITAQHRIKHKNTYYEIVGKPLNVDFANTVTLIQAREITDA